MRPVAAVADEREQKKKIVILQKPKHVSLVKKWESVFKRMHAPTLKKKLISACSVYVRGIDRVAIPLPLLLWQNVAIL